mmetsp:Transcript_38399/g.98193  ORF Transcript_38399/g.98193 Transcript_38399/m.98193 type:complete len:211 (+) Transcript_38399:411-1043(+)
MDWQPRMHPSAAEMSPVSVGRWELFFHCASSMYTSDAIKIWLSLVGTYTGTSNFAAALPSESRSTLFNWCASSFAKRVAWSIWLSERVAAVAVLSSDSLVARTRTPNLGTTPAPVRSFTSSAGILKRSCRMPRAGARSTDAFSATRAGSNMASLLLSSEWQGTHGTSVRRFSAFARSSEPSGHVRASTSMVWCRWCTAPYTSSARQSCSM